MNRRDFLKRASAATAVLGVLPGAALAPRAVRPLFEISLAEWSLNHSLFSGALDHLDFAAYARGLGIDAVEYVNQFFMDRATDRAYLQEMKTRADGEGVRSVLIMCDNEGALGAPDEAARIQAVENHYKWAEAAAFLGCHAIRVNGFSSGGWGSPPGDYDEEMRLVADGLHRLCQFADGLGLYVLIENHGGHSSDARWLLGVMEKADHPRAGTMPDFGNFRIHGERSYDSYRGVAELMPLARAVSVKPRVWDDHGGQHDLDYMRMMQIVLDAGYRGYCGIEYGREGTERADILLVRQRLEETRAALQEVYG